MTHDPADEPMIAMHPKPKQQAMFSNVSVTCAVCDGEIPVRVNVLSKSHMEDAAIGLLEYLKAHLRRDHPGWLAEDKST